MPAYNQKKKIDWNDPVWDGIDNVILEGEDGVSYCLSPMLERMLAKANKQVDK